MDLEDETSTIVSPLENIAGVEQVRVVYMKTLIGLLLFAIAGL
jgi:hypothetical protein